MTIKKEVSRDSKRAKWGLQHENQITMLSTQTLNLCNNNSACELRIVLFLCLSSPSLLLFCNMLLSSFTPIDWYLFHCLGLNQ
mmetsp:Transcript_6653/g.7652  ORF Transcript_6653/g.7652 Transcript_6653/m.7652 type:complete len:83 (+) Transcript_6653:269-517(+)